MNVNGGPAIPVKVVTTHKQGGPAIPVYGYPTPPTNRKVDGGPALRVIVITAGDLIQNGGTYRLCGEPTAIPIVTAPATQPVEGGPAIAVYLIGGSL